MRASRPAPARRAEVHSHSFASAANALLIYVPQPCAHSLPYPLQLAPPAWPVSCLQLEGDVHAERQRASSQAHKLGDEAKRLGAQCLELQRELESQTKEVARLKVGLQMISCLLEGMCS